MTASNPELIPLIYRHLKEHGFHSAANELQKLGPQDEAPTSSTLLDIYTAWLKSSKRRKKSATPDQKKTTPKKDPKKKKPDKTTTPGSKSRSKSGSPNKKPTTTKRKKGAGKTTQKVVKSNKTDTLKDKAAGAGDSDSDSSLDVEKWKKRVQEMTETDLAKVEAFNALISPEPKKQRVRKPRAKPKPKTESPVNAQGLQSKMSDETTEGILAKSSSTQKSHLVPVVAALDSSNKDQHTETPATSVISTPKQSHKKEKRKAPADQSSLEPKQKRKKTATQNNVMKNAASEDGLMDKKCINENQENTPNLQTEPKNRKKKETILNLTGGDGKNINGNNSDAKTVSLPPTELKLGSQESMTNIENADTAVLVKNSTLDNLKESMPGTDLNSSPNIVNDKDDFMVKVKKKKKKKDKADDGDSQKVIAEVRTSSVINEGACETTVEQANPNTDVHKKKKKKKDKAKDDRESQEAITEAVTDCAINEGACETIVEEASPNTEVHKKKKKKKDKEKDDRDSQQVATEANTNSVINEQACETTVEEACPNTVSKKKKKKNKNKEESETLHQIESNVFDMAVCVEKHTEQTPVKQKSEKKKKHSEEHPAQTPVTEGCEISVEPPDPPSTPQTPGLKKKKHTLDSKNLIKADAVPLTVDDETPKKKKKKASKSKETES